ncbi:amidase [Actinosynnema mirum]|uniref:Amidase n=1 Tax=Actinosynnema mirum (strain ATCC 29888 / DSM 43827 / JCM 3225 / NBRC 14064 / NCIMB 13271 / NRRL B-12336 / IMRU 3971 / 101) TaxID=446462 RepID=C6WPB3_ACTMD|nr:amidase [Actinosynnema mirum]ACU38615.1 Amidase [Actinosynnema mirum DSM 43827]
MPADPTPSETARLAARAGLPLPAERHGTVAVTAGHIHGVITRLRDLDFGDTPVDVPAPVPHAEPVPVGSAPRPTPTHPHELTLAEAAHEIGARRLSPVELVDAVLRRIERVADLNAYAEVLADRARAAARVAERDIAAGRSRGPLHGVPFALKDLVDVAGTRTGAGSRVRDGHRASADSAVAERLAGAGAVLVGKTHTHEFAYGLVTPQTANARRRDRVAGGSSGGSAVAVAAGAATFALGADTGGSIRVPAALNGVVGLKPTYDLAPRRGVTSLSWTLDHVGPITRTARDAALVLAALTGQRPAEGGGPADLAGLRVGVPGNYYFDRVTPDVEAAVRAAIASLESRGARLVDVAIPMADHVHAVHRGLMVPEATACHERTLREAPERYGEDVRVLLEAGELVGAGDYLRARRATTLVRRAWARLWTEVDVLAAPTTPTTAVPVGSGEVRRPDGGAETVADAYVRLCAPANVTGGPAVTVPVGVDPDGLPIGLRLLAAPGADHHLLRWAAACDRWV